MAPSAIRAMSRAASWSSWRALLFRHLFQPPGDVLRGNALEVEPLAPGQNGGQQLVDLCGGQNKDDVGGGSSKVFSRALKAEGGACGPRR